MRLIASGTKIVAILICLICANNAFISSISQRRVSSISPPLRLAPSLKYKISPLRSSVSDNGDVGSYEDVTKKLSIIFRRIYEVCKH